MMGILLWATLLSVISAPSATTTCAPSKLTHVVFRQIAPAVDSRSFSAQPISLYRQGSGKSRSEEADDPAQRLHQLFVTAEPNIWMINLYDNTGMHVIDPGPTYDTHSPIFVGPGVSPHIMALEFGCEADFIKNNALAPVRVEIIEGTSYDVYQLKVEDDTIEILQKAGALTPGFARFYRAGKLLLARRYDLYETNLKDDPSLFTPPTGVKYEEQKPN